MIRYRPPWPSQSQELLLRAAVLEGDDALGAWRAWRASESLTDIDADSRRLLPLLCRKLLALGVNDSDIAILKNTYRHEWLANQLRMQAAARALRALGDAGIDTMVLKGAALAGRHYHDLGARPMNDVDVLVRPERAQVAAEVLLDAGWRQFVPTELRLVLPVTHGTAFRDDAGIGIDLHWYAMWSPAVEDDFWAAAEPFELIGGPTVAQSAPDQLLQVCVHGLWSYGQRLQWVPDAFAVIRSTPELDWDRMVDRARERSLTLPLAETLRYLRDRLGAPIPPSVLKAVCHSRSSVLERAANRAWNGPPSKPRQIWLMLERYRRQRPLPDGPTREPNMWRYFRAYARTQLGLQDSSALAPALVRSLLPRAT